MFKYVAFVACIFVSTLFSAPLPAFTIPKADANNPYITPEHYRSVVMYRGGRLSAAYIMPNGDWYSFDYGSNKTWHGYWYIADGKLFIIEVDEKERKTLPSTRLKKSHVRPKLVNIEHGFIRGEYGPGGLYQDTVLRIPK